MSVRMMSPPHLPKPRLLGTLQELALFIEQQRFRHTLGDLEGACIAAGQRQEASDDGTLTGGEMRRFSENAQILRHALVVA